MLSICIPVSVEITVRPSPSTMEEKQENHPLSYLYFFKVSKTVNDPHHHGIFPAYLFLLTSHDICPSYFFPLLFLASFIPLYFYSQYKKRNKRTRHLVFQTLFASYTCRALSFFKIRNAIFVLSNFGFSSFT